MSYYLFENNIKQQQHLLIKTTAYTTCNVEIEQRAHAIFLKVHLTGKKNDMTMEQ